MTCLLYPGELASLNPCEWESFAVKLAALKALLIKCCQAKVYAPAGTHNICREHILNYLTWRRRKGPQMFMKYAGMTMEERDPLVAEWANTIRVEEVPTASAPKT